MLKSDHSPLLITMDDNMGGRRNRFIFQAAWLSHPEFQSLIDANWVKEGTAGENAKHIAPILNNWNKDCFGNVLRRKHTLLAKLEGIQRARPRNHHNGIINLERKLRSEHEAVLYQEEVLWFQKSREEWICSGDRNTKYYHTTINIKKAWNRVTQLMDQAGNWVHEDNNLKNMIRDYFKDIFMQEQGHTNVKIACNSFLKVDNVI